MNKVIIGITILALMSVIGLIVSINKGIGTASQITQEQNTITLTPSGFDRSTLTIKAGTLVTWINKSGTDATVNSAPHPLHTDYPLLNLGSFPNEGILSLTFDRSGTYKYHNHLNPSQTGTIVVQ